ncbi:MAG: glutamine amidotransferase [Phycisphaerae bacterium]
MMPGTPLFAWFLVRFETPAYLVLLAVLPFLVVLSFRSLAGLGSARRIVAVTARCVVMTAMVLALAGAHRVKTSDELAVIYVVDRSNSIPRNLQQKAFDYIRQSESSRGPKDRLAVIAFDGVSAVEQLPMGTLAIERLPEPVAPDETNLAAAMRMAMALFPPDAARRIVLISDGNENAGEALAESDQLRAAGVPLDVVPVEYRHGDEVVFERLTAPARAASDETVNLQMVLRSEKATTGRVLLYHNDQLVPLGEGGEAGYRVELDPGPNRFTIPVPLRVDGAHRFRAVFEPGDAAADTISSNNEGRAFTIVAGQGRVLILTTDEDQASAVALREALAAEELAADAEVAGSNPLDQVRLLQYSLVILSNVPAYLISEADQRGLASYVRDLGGGLIMLGGDESFGAGGWLGSPVEEVMPVTFDVKSKKQIPKGALCLVMHACEIPQGNYWGERVAVAAVKTLSSRDLVGVLSWQWRDAKQRNWVVPLRTVGNKTEVIQQIMQMQMGDMPSLEEVVGDAVEALIARRDAVVKHIIIISDFDPQGPSATLVDKMVRNGVSASTVAIGYGSHWIDDKKAKWVADETKGKFYATRNYSELPQIFMKEARVVRRSLINEQTFTPRLVNPLSPTIAGLSGDEMPPLHGYVLTSPKPLADVPLIRPTEEGDDPVLAQWSVGLGKTVAFTSGMWPRWGADWVAWPKFSKVWAQIARWASRQAESAAFDVTSTVVGGRGKIRVDAVDKNAAAVNFMNMEGVLISPGPKYDAMPLRLTQTGPGHYEGDFEAREPGSYIVNLSYRMGSGPDAASGMLQTGVSVAYSPEYKELQANLPLLRALAERTGGRVLDLARVDAPYQRAGLPRAEARRPIWEDLVRLFLILFLLDVAVRRIAINPVELLRKLRRFIGELGRPRRPDEASAAVLASLKGTRGVVREGMAAKTPAAPTEAGTPPDKSARYEAAQPDWKVGEQLSKALGGASEVDQPVVAKPTRKPQATSEADYTSRLLQAKKRARDDLKKDEDEK